MPSKSKAQHNFMAAVANNPQFARRAGVPQSVGREYMKADEGRSFNKGGDLVSKCGSRRKSYKSGGSLKMVEKNGEQVPFYAADGVGNMAYGGKVKGMKTGGNVRGAGICRKGVRPCKMV